jgi:hypothetical protein
VTGSARSRAGRTPSEAYSPARSARSARFARARYLQSGDLIRIEIETESLRWTEHSVV